MVKLEWGTKRTCQNCQSRFYDLQRSPITCPKCGSIYEIVVTSRKGKKAPVIEDSDIKLEEIETDVTLNDEDDSSIDEDDLIDEDDVLDDDLDDVSDVRRDSDEDH